MADYFTQNLEADEIVVRLVRKHLLASVRFVLTALVMLLVPLVLVNVLLASAWGGVLFVVLLVTGLVYGFYAYIRWYFDSVVITDRRLVHIHQRGLFHRDVQEVSYDRVRDISYGIHGVVATSFNFGTITLAFTDGTTLLIAALPRPALVQETLKTLVAQYRDSHGTKELSARELIDVVERAAHATPPPPTPPEAPPPA